MNPDMTGDRELNQFRQQHYGLFVSLFVNEPTDDLLNALRNGIDGRADAAERLHPELGQGWRTLAEVLPTLTGESATAEFLRLFIGPTQPESTPYESWYLTGQLFQKPLVTVRAFMSTLGLERDEKRFPEPEDVLGFELEIMNWLIARQLEAPSPEEEVPWLDQQQDFLHEHLLVWAPTFSADLEKAKSSVLYKGVAQLLRGFLAWEQQEFQIRGMEGVQTLEQARKHYPQRPRFSGPLVEDQFQDPSSTKPV